MKHFIQIVKLPLCLVSGHSTLLWGSPNLGPLQDWDEVNAVCCFYLVLLAGQKSGATGSRVGSWNIDFSMELVGAWVPALPSPRKFLISLSLLCHVSNGDNFCISYLLLCNKLPPNKATKYNKQLLLHEFLRVPNLEMAQLSHSSSRSHYVAGKMLVGASIIWWFTGVEGAASKVAQSWSW